jgi:K+/H+ antiporter YhaU regulatory subunit KhtT
VLSPRQERALPSLNKDGLFRIEENETETKEARLLQFIGYSLDSVLGAPPVQRMRAIYKMEDSIRNNQAATNDVDGAAMLSPSGAAADRVIVTATDDDTNLVILAIDTADRSGLLLDLSKCIARLQLELHHTEAAVRHGRSLSIWRCESKKLNDEYLAEIWTVLHATLMADKGAQAVKQRGQRVIRAQVCMGSRLAGKTPAELNFRETYMAAIVAVQRDGKGVTPESSSLADFRFCEGDVVVLQVSDESPLLQSPPTDFYGGSDDSPVANGLAKRLRSFSQSFNGDNAATSAPDDVVAAEAAQLEANDGTKAILAVWADLRVLRSETDAGASREFLTAVNVVGSSLVGKTAAEAGIERLPNLLLVR